MSMTFEEALEYIYKVVKCREQDKAKCNGCESCPYNFEFGWTYKAEKAIAQYYEEERRRQEIIPAQPEQRWIPCSERMPDNRVSVIVCYREWQQYANRYIYSIVIGWYARKHSVRENVFSEWEADCDYKEDEDEFYIQEGWYEFTTQGNGDLMNWYIGGAEVVAWMPLPEPYKSEAERRTDEHRNNG